MTSKAISNIFKSVWKNQQIFSRRCSKNIVVSETDILSSLRKKFPTADVTVEDTSGGCGAMFNIFVEAEEFKGLPVMKQHRQVYDALDEQIKKIHGIHLETKVRK